MRTRLASLATVSLLSLAAVAHADGAALLNQLSESDPGPQDSITINPIEAVVGFANLAYERAVSRHASIQVEALYGSVTLSTVDSMQTDTLASVSVQPHFYFGDRTLEGFYVAPLLQLVQLDVKDSAGVTASGTGVAAGATAGYAWLLGPVDLKLGLGAKVASASARGVSSDGKVAEASAVGAGLTMDLSAGFAF